MMKMPIVNTYLPSANKYLAGRVNEIYDYLIKRSTVVNLGLK